MAHSPLFITPLTTEKAYAQSLNNTYIFSVPTTANRQEITEAVEKQFDVTVISIKTLVQNGKSVRFSRGKNRYPGTTNRTDSKKAYVTLKAGDKLDIFEQPTEEAPKKADKAKEGAK